MMSKCSKSLVPHYGILISHSGILISFNNVEKYFRTVESKELQRQRRQKWNGFAQDAAVQVGVTSIVLAAIEWEARQCLSSVLLSVTCMLCKGRNNSARLGPLFRSSSYDGWEQGGVARWWKGRLDNQKEGSCCCPSYSQYLPFKFPVQSGTECSGGCDAGKLKSPGVQHQAHSQPHQAQAHTQRVWHTDEHRSQPQHSKRCRWCSLCCSSLA